MSDYISRADAIEAVLSVPMPLRLADEIDELLRSLPSAEFSKCDLISRADAIAYIDRVINSGLGRNKSLNYIHKYISALPSADAEFADLPDIPRAYYERVVGNMAHEINMLKEQLESADAVSVVRCKDCKWQKFIDWGMGDCLHPKGSRHIAYDNHYCSYGERREP